LQTAAKPVCTCHVWTFEDLLCEYGGDTVCQVYIKAVSLQSWSLFYSLVVLPVTSDVCYFIVVVCYIVVLCILVPDVHNLPNVPQHEPGSSFVATSMPKSREQLLDGD